MADELLELEVGAVAHGGACVARYEGRVVFVRHALSGERVRAQVTEDAGRFLRADAVQVLTASADRVAPPCPHAGPGRCGGCDWQHVHPAAQRRLKAALIAEQFARVGGIAGLEPEVEELPGGALGWRTRVTYAVDRDGRPGLHRHRSHEVEPVSSCPLGAPRIGDAEALGQEWPGLTGVEVARGAGPEVAVLGHRPGSGRQARGRRPPDRVELISGPAELRHDLLGRRLTVSAGGFWQVHPAVAEALARAVLDAVRPRTGERVVDLYAGAGALTSALADAVGPDGEVVGLEASAAAVIDAGRNLADRPWADVRRGRVDAAAVRALGPTDLVVLDPPRAGAGPDVLAALVALRPRAIAYVSCEPATLARDVRAALDAGREAGWGLAGLRAFDAFPMTQHVECLATLRPLTGSQP